jgi:hypothetical protein
MIDHDIIDRAGRDTVRRDRLVLLTRYRYAAWLTVERPRQALGPLVAITAYFATIPATAFHAASRAAVSLPNCSLE